MFNFDLNLLDPPTLIPPISPTPHHSLYLSNLDDQDFLRFQIKYLYVFRRAIPAHLLKASLSRVLVPYYPFAGRLQRCCTSAAAAAAAEPADTAHRRKLQILCNAKGAVFAEASADFTADHFLEFAARPDRSLRKLLCSVDVRSFIDVPPLVIQVTNLRCGGMILCTAINHCFSDGVGTSQFLHAWAHLTRQSSSTSAFVQPFHCRHVLTPRNPPQVQFPHPGFTNTDSDSHAGPTIHQFLQSQPLIPASITFSTSQILQLKRQCSPCTTFEALAYHTWRSWVKSFDLPPSMTVKLLFSVNFRKVFDEMPKGYYGNGFVLACAEAEVRELAAPNPHDGVKLVQQAKAMITEEYIRSMIDMMEDPTVRVDLTSSLVIAQWSRLGLHELDFGHGKPLHMGPLGSYIYCVFLPVMGEPDAVRVLVSMPDSVVDKFKFYMMEFSQTVENNGDAKKQYGSVDNVKMVQV